MVDIDITRTREVEASCPRCGRKRRLPIGWRSLMRLSASEDWDGQLRCTDGHTAVVMTLQKCITCPECKLTSFNPNDVEQGYCGKCHWWTSDSQLGRVRP